MSEYGNECQYPTCVLRRLDAEAEERERTLEGSRVAEIQRLHEENAGLLAQVADYRRRLHKAAEEWETANAQVDFYRRDWLDALKERDAALEARDEANTQLDSATLVINEQRQRLVNAAQEIADLTYWRAEARRAGDLQIALDATRRAYRRLEDLLDERAVDELQSGEFGPGLADWED